MMTALDSSLKVLAVWALVAASGSAFAQNNSIPNTSSPDSWYGGQNKGFWGLSDSVGVRGTLPGTSAFTPPGTSADSLNAVRQFGGYRIGHGFAIEGAQTQFGDGGSGCSDGGSVSATRTCYGSTWSLTGVATLPLQYGLSLHGRLGLHYWQKSFQDDVTHRADEPLGKVYGIGLSYEMTKSITLHAESERYSELTGSNAYGPGVGVGLDSSVHSIGLSVRF